MLTVLRLIAELAARSAARKARFTARRLALWAGAAVLGLTGLGFFLSAGWIALAARLGSLHASLIFGGGFVVLALILALIAGHKPRRRGGLDAETLALIQAQATARAQLAALRAQQSYTKSPALPLSGAFILGLLIALRLKR